ncbi:Protein CBG06843 [Caenorhabditis briggsae]|uniref:Protein CBG06843 n=1 Tax=Caenorhabditis briggsae TaxID=6238 RepID=A8X372_CAEBR|nr:Protein CBG06843 [Caenorhabditis briggsae]CAP27082.2 Protein CBG06843 [Caenorhabditis briggsae]
MESLTPDPNTFRLTPLIQSALKRRTSKKCQENGKPNETDPFVSDKAHQEEEEDLLIQFKRYFCSATKIPDKLMEKLVEKCRENSEFAEELSTNVFNSEIVTSHNIRYQFQTNVIKKFLAALEKDDVPVPDSMFDRLGVLLGLKDGEFVEKLYLDEKGDKVVAKFSESVNQLSMGTTGLSVWQASCDLANLFRLIPSNHFREL